MISGARLLGWLSFHFSISNNSTTLIIMAWTHIVRFIAVEDNQVHLGQLINASRDVGRDSAEGVNIPVYVVNGTIFDGQVTKVILHIKTVRWSSHRCHIDAMKQD
jgi:hypothetical protein